MFYVWLKCTISSGGKNSLSVQFHSLLVLGRSAWGEWLWRLLIIILGMQISRLWLAKSTITLSHLAARRLAHTSGFRKLIAEWLKSVFFNTPCLNTPRSQNCPKLSFYASVTFQTKLHECPCILLITDMRLNPLILDAIVLVGYTAHQ